MRNYFPGFFAHVLYDDGFNNFENFWLAGQEDRAMQIANSDADTLRSVGYNVTDVSIIGKRWFELNKHFFDEILEHVSPQQYWNNGTVLPGVPDENPRDKGFNSKVEKKGARKAADFSGAAGLILYFKNLTVIEQKLRKQGMKREANIVQFAIDQVARQIWSITTALAYLRKNIPSIF